MIRSRPKLVQVITRLIVGGAQLSMLALCEDLAADFDITIVCGPQTGEEGSLHRMARQLAPVIVLDALRRELNPRWDPMAVHALRRTLSRLDPDLVHTNSSKAGICGRFATAPLRARCVHTVHGWGHTPTDPWWRRRVFVGLERAAARRSAAIIAVSEETRRSGLRLQIGTSDLYRVIPEIVDTNPLDPDFAASRVRARESLGLRSSDEVIGWVGRFVAQKDPVTLASALAETLRLRPGARAVLVGDGPERGAVEAFLARHGVRERVMFTGVVHGARSLMPAFDVVVHPSGWEGQPIVVQESLAERIPVVTALVSGVRDLIEDGVNGFVVQPRSSGEMAQAVNRVLSARSMAVPLTSALRASVAQPGRRATVEQHRALYESLLSGEP
jgi:glycosyltransferase involved in cell wall biosynthesis